jgi:hypothetical protein
VYEAHAVDLRRRSTGNRDAVAGVVAEDAVDDDELDAGAHLTHAIGRHGGHDDAFDAHATRLHDPYADAAALTVDRNAAQDDRRSRRIDRNSVEPAGTLTPAYIPGGVMIDIDFVTVTGP